MKSRSGHCPASDTHLARKYSRIKSITYGEAIDGTISADVKVFNIYFGPFMKMPARFISLLKRLIECLATFVLGCLAMLMVLYYFKTSNPVIKVSDVPGVMVIVEHVNKFVLCLASEVPRLNIYLYV